MIRNIWAILLISSWYWRAENILKYFGKQRENISNLVAAAPALAPRPAPGVQELEAEGGEVGEDAQQVYDVHPALDEPDLVGGGDEPDDVLECEPAHKHCLRYLEEILLPCENVYNVGCDVIVRLMMLFIGASQVDLKAFLGWFPVSVVLGRSSQL